MAEVEILVDNGNGQPYDIMELGDVGQIALDVAESTETPLDNSGSSEPPEKGDSGIEDKDSHPNSPTTDKYVLLNGTMTGDVREKIAQKRTVQKTVEQIRTERQRANKGKSYRGAGRGGGTGGRHKNPPRPKDAPEKQSKITRGIASRRRGAVRGRGGKVPQMTRFNPNQRGSFSAGSNQGINNSMNQSMLKAWGQGHTGGKWNLNGTGVTQRGKTTKKKTQFDLENTIIIPSTLDTTWQEFRTAPLDDTYDYYPSTMNKSMQQSMHEAWGKPKGKKWELDETRFSGVSVKSGKWNSSPPRFGGHSSFSGIHSGNFDNLKVTVRRGKHGFRKVESPEIKKKQKASKEILGLIKGTSPPPFQSTSEDKENAGKHILAILRGRKTNCPPKVEINKFKQVLEECIHIPSTLNTTWQEFRSAPNEQTFDLSEVLDEPVEEDDSIATTVKSCILTNPSNTPTLQMTNLQISES